MHARFDCRTTLYYIRHGETDWNVDRRLQGQRDMPLNARGRDQASRCGDILRDLFAQRCRDPRASITRRARSCARGRPWNWRARRSGLPPKATAPSPRSAKSAFGAWEGLTFAQVRDRDPQHLAAREHDKWHFLPPGGESYAMVAARMRAWYDALTRDTVVAAHGGTARGLIGSLGIAKPAAAPLFDIAQGVVYVIEGERLTRYA